MERSGNKFEQAWKDLFESAEIQPREEIWTKIDSGLANRQLNRYRKKVLFYKLLAAASIVLALGIGYFSNLDGFRSEDSGTPIANEADDAQDQAVPDEKNAQAGVQDDGEKNPLIAGGIDKTVVTGDQLTSGDNTEDFRKIEDKVASKGSAAGSAGQEGNSTVLAFNEIDENARENDPVYADGQIEARNQIGEAGQINRMNRPGRLGIGVLAMPDPVVSPPEQKKDPTEDKWFAVYEQTVSQEQEEKTQQNLWAGINFSSGLFDPNISYGSQSANFMSRVSAPDAAYDLVEADQGSFANFTKAVRPEESSFNSEVSFAYGVHVGYQISPRFVVRGGLAYMNSSTSTEISSYIDNPASNRKVAYQALNSVTIESAGVNTVNLSSEEIKLNYTYEFISVPVSLGYYLIDKKFDWMLMAGLSTDFFLKNTFSDENGLFETTEIRAGEDSPYNSSYLNGSLGTLIGMSFADKYRISLEPSYRLGLTDFTKESAAGVSQPSFFFITAGISYIFR
jgi:hypothetical protein